MRIAIVNDMLSAREGLRRIVISRGLDQIAWMAGTGEEALQRCASDLPDLVLMDLIMPGWDGVQTTREIMRAYPCPILVVTASIDANISKVYQAMGAGALDAVVTPPLAQDHGGAAQFLAKIDLMRRLQGTQKAATNPKPARLQGKASPLVVIGSSAGGPFALSRLLKELAPAFAGCIIIVQHVDHQFMAGLAAWLSSEIGREVKLAREHAAPQPGDILLAGEESHLVLTPGQYLEYHEEPAKLIHKPSIDVFFESVAKNWKGKAVGVILTGMGKDGAKGLLALKNKGHFTIAQDRESSAVYGMPKAAAELGAAAAVCALGQIPAEIMQHIQSLEQTPA